MFGALIFNITFLAAKLEHFVFIAVSAPIAGSIWNEGIIVSLGIFSAATH